MKFFLSSIGFTGIDISEKNSKYFEKVFFGKFFQFEKQLKNVFFAKTCVFRRGYRSLWVCYRYGWWCVGNLGLYPCQTRYVWICIVQTDDRIWESKSRIHFVQFLHFSKILLDFNGNVSIETICLDIYDLLENEFNVKCKKVTCLVIGSSHDPKNVEIK